jgi:hypothetical protein
VEALNPPVVLISQASKRVKKVEMGPGVLADRAEAALRQHAQRSCWEPEASKGAAGVSSAPCQPGPAPS